MALDETLGDVNDLERILAITNTDIDSQLHAVRDNADAIFTWDYEKGARPALEKLYEKAKVSQWNGETDLPWDTEVDPVKTAMGMAGSDQRMPPHHGEEYQVLSSV
jgi:hypothetical protein